MPASSSRFWRSPLSNFVQAEIHNQVFQALGFVLQPFQLLRIADGHPAESGLPGVDRCCAHSDLPSQFRHLPPRFGYFGAVEKAKGDSHCFGTFDLWREDFRLGDQPN